MKHEMQAHYPAPVDVVMKMFSDPGFHEKKLQAMNLPGFRILDQERNGDAFRIQVERTVPVQMPGMKKSSATSRVTHTERWNISDATGTVDVEMPGMPLKMHCEARMEAADEGCTVHYVWEIKSSIPVVGKQLEKFVASDMDARADEEADAARALLEGYR